MAGAYCKFCGRRCFVYRHVMVDGEVTWSGHMATCQEGKDHDRASIGVNYTAALNPLINEWDDSLGIPAPCQPIGCDNGNHLPGCWYAAAEDVPTTAPQPSGGES